MELALPQGGTQHYDRRRIFCRERPADERPNAEQRKELSIRNDRPHPLRPVRRFEQPGRQFVSREPLKQHALGAERLQIGERHPTRAASLMNLGDLDQTIRGGKRQRPQQHTVDDAEDGRRRPRSERE